jgi:hypothetical protein
MSRREEEESAAAGEIGNSAALWQVRHAGRRAGWVAARSSSEADSEAAHSKLN